MSAAAAEPAGPSRRGVPFADASPAQVRAALVPENATVQISLLQLVALLRFLKQNSEAVKGTVDALQGFRLAPLSSSRVQQLLADLLAATGAHLHLVGHSYGGKVVLSALCAGTIPRPVESLLLLQPAMSYLCFSPQIAGVDRPGGYRPALDPQRCRQPILTTFSSHDEPLTRQFHLFVRRRSDLAEQLIAAKPPSRYAALGGYGPALVGGESIVVPANDPGMPYALGGGARVVGVESSRVISGHSDVSNAWTWWMLLDQVDREN